MTTVVRDRKLKGWLRKAFTADCQGDSYFAGLCADWAWWRVRRLRALGKPL
jgi:hypothetical protein